SKLSMVLPGGSRASGEMTLDAAASALGHLMLGERGQKARRRPPLLIGLGSQRGPDLLGGGQPQLGKQQHDTRGIDWVSRPHATSPNRTVPSSSYKCNGANSTVISGMAAGSGANRRARRSRSGTLPASSSASMISASSASQARSWASTSNPTTVRH